MCSQEGEAVCPSPGSETSRLSGSATSDSPGEQLAGQGPPGILHGSPLPGGQTGSGGARRWLSLETSGVAS